MGPAGDLQNANGSGVPQTKKRSRTGSLTSTHTSPEQRGSDKAELLSKPRPTPQQLLLDQYVPRDLQHAAALNSQTTPLTDIIRSKRKEAEFYSHLRRERPM